MGSYVKVAKNLKYEKQLCQNRNELSLDFYEVIAA